MHGIKRILEDINGRNPLKEEIDVPALKKAWANAKGKKQKDNIIIKFNIPGAFSKNRGGEIKLGHQYDLQTNPKKKLIVHDDEGNLFYLTGKPMKLIKFEETSIEGEEISEGFDLLPGHVINNELYVASRELQEFTNRMRAGNDFKKKDLQKIIRDLQGVVKSARTFSKPEDVPVSYQYKK